MTEETLTNAQMRRFLLGAVEDEERQRIESLYLVDPETREHLLAAEQELLDDYLNQSLSATELEGFLAQYGETEAQQHKLEIAKSIKDWAARPSHRTPVESVSLWSKFVDWFRLRRTIAVPVAVTVAIALVVGVVWVSTRMSEQRRQLAIEQELAQLNSPVQLSQVRPSEPPVILKPGSLRGVSPEPTLTRPRENTFAEVRLLWLDHDDYPVYKVVVHRASDNQSFAIPNLRLENDGGKVIRVRLPAHILTPGSYQIYLSGEASGQPRVYSFAVSE